MKVHIHETSYVGFDGTGRYIRDIRWAIFKNGKEVEDLFYDYADDDGPRLMDIHSTIEVLKALGISATYTSELKDPIK